MLTLPILSLESRGSPLTVSCVAAVGPYPVEPDRMVMWCTTCLDCEGDGSGRAVFGTITVDGLDELVVQ